MEWAFVVMIAGVIDMFIAVLFIQKTGKLYEAVNLKERAHFSRIDLAE